MTTNDPQAPYGEPKAEQREPLLSDHEMMGLSTYTSGVEDWREPAEAVRDWYEAKITSGELMVTPRDWLELTAMCRAYYRKDGNSCGGLLHVILDDSNVDCIESCRVDCLANGDTDGLAILDRLEEMEEDDRYAWWLMSHRAFGR